MKTHCCKVLRRGVVACITILAIISSAAAAQIPGPSVEPQYTGISAFQVSLDIADNGYASCYSSVRPNSGYSVELIMELQQDGTTIKTWSASGSSKVTLDKTYFVVRNHSYQIVATAKVKNASNIIVSTPSAASSIQNY